MTIFKNPVFWLNLIIILIASIFFFFGFLAGYFYLNKSCLENPLSYGLKKINNINNADLICSCFSPSNKFNSFTFDEKGIKK